MGEWWALADQLALAVVIAWCITSGVLRADRQVDKREGRVKGRGDQ